MSSYPELPAPKPPITLSKSDGYYPLGDPLTQTIQSSDDLGSCHSTSGYSDYTTFSASAIGAESDVFATTSDTLGMIETPWTTESWQSRLTNITTPRYPSTASEFMYVESTPTLTTFTIEPKSSPSCGVTSPSLFTLNDSNDTWKCTSFNSVFTINRDVSVTETAKAHNADSLDTISSWTVQSFTSAGLVEESKVLVKYPWSPRTVRSDSTGVTAYPSSISFEPQSAFATATTPSAAASQTDFNRVIPVNYLVLDTMHHIFKNP